ncbi:MAG: cupin domain-containing protein [Leptolyngbya sp. PLA3]|nr:MAG: cupin domain-containing protein [Cyanobacteria bacterium CYA]MCE7967217.1 cupin domain-containing protein [Leptolyngbya sp. PL-A3]
MPPITAHRWDKPACDHPMLLRDRRRVIGQQPMLSMVTLHNGFQLDPHEHENEPFSCVLEGRIGFTLVGGAATRTVTLEAGQVLHLPPNAPPGAEARETSLILDVSSPPRATTGVNRPQATSNARG